MACFSPSGPVFTNRTIQATRSPPIRDQTRNYRLGARTPNLQAVPRLTGCTGRIIRRQAAGGLLEVLQPHADVEPVEDGRLSDAGISEDALEAWAPIGEGGQPRLLASSDGVEAAVDQHLDVGIGFGDGAEHLSAASRRFDIADPHLQMPLVRLTAADEG